MVEDKSDFSGRILLATHALLITPLSLLSMDDLDTNPGAWCSTSLIAVKINRGVRCDAIHSEL